MKELENNIENRLDHLKMGQPFTVPEGYFETFHERLKARIEAEERPEPKRGLLFYLKPALGLAASFALIFLLVYVPLVKFMPGKDYMAQQTTDNVTADTSADISPAVFSYFTEGQFLSAFEEMEEYNTNTISPDAIVEYLAINCSDYEIVKANN